MLFKKFVIFSVFSLITSMFGQSFAADLDLEERAGRSARSCVIYFQNNSAHTLTRTDHGLSHGVWDETPTRIIGAGQRGVWASSSHGVMTGTDGFARYSCNDCGGIAVIDIKWTIPYLGGNGYEGVVGGDVHALERAEEAGNNAKVRFTFN